MSEEPEEKQPDEETEEAGDVYNDNSVHHAVDLWPLVYASLVAAIVLLAIFFLPSQDERAKVIPWGKSYKAVGNMILCVPFQATPSISAFDAPYRALIRTPEDNVFEVAFRHGNEPPAFANAIGEITYHACGQQGGRSVYCFDAFQFKHEGAKPLDANGQPIPPQQLFQPPKR